MVAKAPASLSRRARAAKRFQARASNSAKLIGPSEVPPRERRPDAAPWALRGGPVPCRIEMPRKAPGCPAAVLELAKGLWILGAAVPADRHGGEEAFHLWVGGELAWRSWLWWRGGCRRGLHILCSLSDDHRADHRTACAGTVTAVHACRFPTTVATMHRRLPRARRPRARPAHSPRMGPPQGAPLLPDGPARRCPTLACLLSLLPPEGPIRCRRLPPSASRQG